MNTFTLIDNIINSGIKLKLDSGKLKIIAPPDKLTPVLLQQIKSRKAEIVELLSGINKSTAITPVEKKEYYYATSAQKRLYIIQKMDTGSIAYNMPQVISFDEGSEQVKVEDIFMKLIARHESLRTSFLMINEEIVQKIDEKVVLKIDRFQNQNERLTPNRGNEIRRNFIRPFDISEAPLLRVGVIKTNEGKYTFLLDMHHIVTDGTSQAILVKEFMALYNAEELPPLRLQYKDYSEWQKSKKQRPVIKEQEKYWMEIFSNEIPVLNLPTDYPRPIMQSFEGSRVDFLLAVKESQVLKEISAQTGATLYMCILSVFTILLARLSGQEDIVVGTPIAARKHVDLEKVIGFFVNTLAMRISPRGEKSYKEFLLELKERTLEAYENQDYPFEELVDKLSLKRDIGRNPLFDVMFALQNMNTPLAAQVEEKEIEKTRHSTIGSPGEFQYISQASKFDLTLTTVEKGRGLLFSFQYCTKLFKKESIERFIVYFKTILSTVVNEPSKKLNEIKIISDAEKNLLLYEFNDSQADYPKEKTIHQLFEEQVESTPDNIAVVGPSVLAIPEMFLQTTYKELNEESNRAAYTLLERGIKSDTIVGIMMERSVEMIIGILGILKAGGAYLPIDPGYPQERVNYMLKDSGTIVLVTSNDLEKLPIIPTSQLPNFHFSPAASLAYIIYTSGTTGKPKGVLVEHRCAVNTLLSRKNEYKMNASDKVMQFFSYAFDGFITSFFTPIISGSAVVLPGIDEIRDIAKIRSEIAKHAVNHFISVPSLYHGIISDMPSEDMHSLRVITLAGEILPPQLPEISRRKKNNLELAHEYGVTEAAVMSTIFRHQEKSSRILIGKPIANTRIFILNLVSEFQVLGLGVVGELCISGGGIARGYLNNPELTAEKFIQPQIYPNLYRFIQESYSPTHLLTHSTIYRTGDMARWLSDGNIEFLGRIDHQVKIRGFRIELGEIENCLLRIVGVKEAVVAAREEDGGDKYICAYYVSASEFEISAVREFLLKELPDYMIPSYFVRLEKIPLTPNGKVDRKALPGPERVTGESYIVPRDEVERKLVEIWAEVLLIEKEKISIESNFFELGGHSLKATILVSKIHKEFEVRLPLAEIFKAPRIEALAVYIKGRNRDKYMSIKPVEQKEYYPLSSAQKRLYILQQMQLGSTAYNMPEVIPLSVEYDRKKIEDAFKKLIKRHESLRTSFQMKVDTPVLVVHDKVEFNLSLLDSKDFIRQFIKPFDLAKAPLIHAGLIKDDHNLHILIVDVHHIISDGISREVLIKDFLAFDEGEELLPLRIQFKDFSIWQNGEKEIEKIKHQERYWLKEFSGEIPVLELPTDYPRLVELSFEGNSIHFQITEEETQGLNALALEENSTLFMVLAAVFCIFLSKLGGHEDIIIGTPIAGRRHSDLEKIIGMFVNTLSLRNYPHGKLSFREFLSDVKERTLKAFENQEYPFEELVQNLSVKRDIGRNPLFDVMFDLQNINKGSAGQHKDKEIENSHALQYNSANKYGNMFQATKFDLSLTAVETGRVILFSFQYFTSLFKKKTIEQFIGYFKKIVSICVQNPDIRISEIEIITEEQKKWILFDINDTETEIPNIKTIHQLFEEQVEKAPDKSAALDLCSGVGSESMLHITYNELNEKSNRLALMLKEKGIQAGTTVGIKIERSIQMIIRTLGILKSDGAYLPIDPDCPPERIQYMLKDSGTEILFTGQEIEDFDSQRPFEIRPTGVTSHLHLYLPPVPATTLAYIIYTSGSTGRPKGVMVEHRNVVRLVKNAGYIHYSMRDRLLPTGAVAFDISTFEIWSPLLNGVMSFLVSKGGLLSAETLKNILVKHDISVLHLIPQLFNNIAAQDIELFAGLHYFLVGGDLVMPEAVNRLRNTYPHLKIVQCYGPTENTTFSTTFQVDKDYEIRIPIGKPIRNSSAFIVDKYGHLQPVGVPGELLVGGDGVARGYLNNPELTAEKFVEISDLSGQRIYKTGDLARWLPDGNMEFLGRNDNQIKLRGLRIELGEIENALCHHEAIEECVTINRQFNGEDHIIAYYKKKKKIEFWPSLAEYFVYDDLIYHSMVNDDSRNEKYRNAIRKAVKDKVVLEIGPGSEAILSRFCVEAGAKRVYAVEILEEPYRKARKTIREFKLKDKITIIHGDITKVNLLGKVDCCISEIVGSIGGSEGAAKIINTIHPFMKTPYIIIPSKALTKIAAITLPEGEFEFSFEDVGAHYVEKVFNQVGRKFDLRLGLLNFTRKHLISNSDVFEELDFTKENLLEAEHDIYLEITHNSVFNGFIVWLNLYCDEDEVIDTLEKKYIWLPIYFPVFSEGEVVEKGDYVRATVTRKLSENQINPDYILRGKLYKNQGNQSIDFIYHSPHVSSEYKGNDFYKKIFSKEELKISKRIFSSELREYLAYHLPSFMIPSYFVPLESIPLTLNGKIDRKALPGPEAAVTPDGYLPPLDEAEEKLTVIWAEVLGIEKEKIGVQHNFFELGGNSLRLVTMVSKINKEFGHEVPITKIYHKPSIREISKLMLTKNFEEDPVVLLNKTNPKKIFCFPPQIGYGIFYLPLSRILNDYSFYAFSFIEDLEPGTRLEKYVDIITGIQPVGPYLLYGYSMAGKLTFQVAKTLENRGCQVSDIIYFDCFFIENRIRGELDSDEVEYLYQYIDDLVEELQVTSLKEKVVEKTLKFMKYDDSITKLEKIDANVHLILSTEAQNNENPDHNCWKHLTSKDNLIYNGSGGHQEMFSGDALEKNADIMRGILENIELRT